MMRLLSAAHLAWGLALLLLAAWFATSSLRVLPHMSTGTIRTNLPAALMIAFTLAGPPAALGAWMVILGRRLRAGRPDVRTALLATHALMLLPGFLALAYGWHALRAAERSAARGGGLLGAIGAVPVAIGAGISLLALCSIAVALALPRERTST